MPHSATRRPIEAVTAATTGGIRWQVLAEQESSTVLCVEFDADLASAQHDPHDTELAAAVRAHASQLIAQGDAEIVRTDRQPARIISWELAGSAPAREALRHHTQRIT